MRRALLAAVVALSLAFAAGAQGAKSVKTHVGLDLFVPTAGKLFAVGSVSAGDERCVGDRTVEILLIPGNKAPVRIDTARTADRGGWMGFRKESGIPDQNYTAVKLVVAKTSVRVSKNKEITCGRKSKSFALAG
jgi:hypothetical protein